MAHKKHHASHSGGHKGGHHGGKKHHTHKMGQHKGKHHAVAHAHGIHSEHAEHLTGDHGLKFRSGESYTGNPATGCYGH